MSFSRFWALSRYSSKFGEFNQLSLWIFRAHTSDNSDPSAWLRRNRDRLCQGLAGARRLGKIPFPALRFFGAE
jgi:hypothetical protein